MCPRISEDLVSPLLGLVGPRPGYAPGVHDQEHGRRHGQIIGNGRGTFRKPPWKSNTSQHIPCEGRAPHTYHDASRRGRRANQQSITHGIVGHHGQETPHCQKGLNRHYTKEAGDVARRRGRKRHDPNVTNHKRQGGHVEDTNKELTRRHQRRRSHTGRHTVIRLHDATLKGCVARCDNNNDVDMFRTNDMVVATTTASSSAT